MSLKPGQKFFPLLCILLTILSTSLVQRVQGLKRITLKCRDLTEEEFIPKQGDGSDEYNCKKIVYPISQYLTPIKRTLALLHFKNKPQVEPGIDYVNVSFTGIIEGSLPLHFEICGYAVMFWKKGVAPVDPNIFEFCNESSAGLLEGLMPDTEYEMLVGITFVNLKKKQSCIGNFLESEGFTKVSFNTQKCPEVPPIPTGLRIENGTSSSFKVLWDDIVFAKTCNIQYSLKTDQGSTDSVTLNTTVYKAENLAAFTTYNVSLEALSKEGNTSKVTFVSTKTLPTLLELLAPEIVDNSISSTLDEISVAWRRNPVESQLITNVFYKVTFEGKTNDTNETQWKFTDLDPDSSYILALQTCITESVCSEKSMWELSTQPSPPEVEEKKVEVLKSTGTTSKIKMPKLKKGKASQYVVVMKINETLSSASVKNESVKIVKKYIHDHQHPSSDAVEDDDVDPLGWVAGIMNTTEQDNETREFEIGGGEGDNKPLKKGTQYNVVVVTEKKSGKHSTFTTTDPINVRGEAVASGLSGIMFGALIFLVLICLAAWTYKKNKSKNQHVVRTPEEEPNIMDLL